MEILLTLVPIRTFRARYKKEWYVSGPMQKAGGAVSLWDVIRIPRMGGGGGGGGGGGPSDLTPWQALAIRISKGGASITPC